MRGGWLVVFGVWVASGCGGTRTVPGAEPGDRQTRVVVAAQDAPSVDRTLKPKMQGDAPPVDAPPVDAPPVDAPPDTVAPRHAKEDHWVVALPPSDADADADADAETDAAPPTGSLTEAMSKPAAAKSRRQRFAQAVAAISKHHGRPISEAKALEDRPCGGWSGPGCSNFTLGIELAKIGAPIIARFHRKKTADIARVMSTAVSEHSIWHDAYGYVYRKKKVGPGYAYAGCLFSRCDKKSPRAGQVDGILYQVGRLLKSVDGPACGPDCKLEDS